MDDPIGTADKRLEKAKVAFRNVEGLEGNLKTVEANLKTAQSEYKLAEARVGQRQRSRSEVKTADQDVVKLKREESAAQEAANGAQKAFNDAEEAHGEAKTVLEASQKSAAAARRLAKFLRKSEELEAAQVRLKEADKADQNATSLTAKANASPFTPEALEDLRCLDGNAREAVALLQAVATRLELAPDKGSASTHR